MNRLRVLLVDDEIMIREGFKKLFNWEEHDCQVIDEAADGAQALNKIDSLVPDLVIMDINLPLINGLKVIQQAKVRHPDMAFIISSIRGGFYPPSQFFMNISFPCYDFYRNSRLI